MMIVSDKLVISPKFKLTYWVGIKRHGVLLVNSVSTPRTAFRNNTKSKAEILFDLLMSAAIYCQSSLKGVIPKICLEIMIKSNTVTPLVILSSLAKEITYPIPFGKFSSKIPDSSVEILCS